MKRQIGLKQMHMRILPPRQGRDLAFDVAAARVGPPLVKRPRGRLGGGQEISAFQRPPQAVPTVLQDLNAPDRTAAHPGALIADSGSALVTNEAPVKHAG